MSVHKAWGKNIQRAAYRWGKSVDRFMEIADKNKSRIITVKYENLVTHPSATLKKICDFLNIPYEREMDRLDHVVEYVGDARNSSIQSGNINKYKLLMSQRDIEEVELLTLNTLKKFYELNTDVQHQRTPSAFKKISWFCYDVYKLMVFHSKQQGFIKGLKTLKKLSRPTK